MAAATFTGMLGSAVTMLAVGAFIDTVICLAKNENLCYEDQGSMFTYASIVPSLVRLNKDNRQIDTNLKIMLAMTVIELQKIVGETKVPEWNDIVSIMRQNVLFEKCEDSSRYGIRTYTRDSNDFCKFDGGPDKGTIENIKIWFMKELETIDPELKELTGVLENKVFEKLASIVASTGSSVNSISTMIRRSEYEEYTLADIGLIRYPSYEKPKAKIFRLKIKSWRNCKRILAFESNKNGLTVEIDSQEYMPREEIVSHMRDHVFSDEDVTYLCEKVDSILLKI